MSRFIMLHKFTDQGVARIKDSPGRVAAFRQAAARVGVTVEAIYWLMGEFDGLVVLDAPDEAAATALALDLGAHGSVRTHLLRAFDEAEFKAVLAKL